jgi:hypothetical protein
MATDIKESDWKVFRRLHRIALERFCERVLKEVQAAAAEHTDGYHDSYLKVFTLIRDRDKTIASAFNDPRRSNAFILLANIKHEGLLTAAELDQFSPEARQAIDSHRKRLARITNRQCENLRFYQDCDSGP